MTTFHWYSGSLVVENPPPKFKDVLEYQHRTLVPDGMGGRVSKSSTVQLFNELPDGRLVTYQGFLSRLIRTLRDDSHTIFDHRLPLPKPHMEKATGFRHFQREVFFEALRYAKSGIIKIPTRTGKTYLAMNLMRIWPKVPTVFAAPGVDLLNQQMETFKEEMPDREIKGLFSGSRSKGYSEDLTVCSLDSLAKIPWAETRLLIVDEPHAAVSPGRSESLAKFENARIYGLGATTSGRFDGADILLEGLMGPVLVQRTFQQAVAAGAICPIMVYMLRMPQPLPPCRTRDQAYRKMVFENHNFNQVVQQLTAKIIHPHWQTLVFIDEKKQGALLERMVSDGVVAIASNMTAAQRRENFAGMESGRILRGISTDIYGTGVTFPYLRASINAAGGGGHISSTQRPGRLAQILPGKTYGYLFDFLHERQPGSPTSPSCESVIRDGYSRLKTYRENGYEIRIVDNLDQIELLGK